MSISGQVTEPQLAEPPLVPEAMRRVQKCSSCGFPVSEGRTLCLDCETLDRLKLESEKKAREKAAGGNQPTTKPVAEISATTEGAAVAETSAEKQAETSQSVTSSNPLGDGERDDKESGNQEDQQSSTNVTDEIVAEEILPPFLTNPQLTEESWLARHVNLLAFLVLVAAVLVAAVVFFH